MIKVENWTYERGMQRIKWWKEEGNDVRKVFHPDRIHIYRNEKYAGTMDHKNGPHGYQLKQTLN